MYIQAYTSLYSLNRRTFSRLQKNESKDGCITLSLKILNTFFSFVFTYFIVGFSSRSDDDDRGLGGPSGVPTRFAHACVYRGCVTTIKSPNNIASDKVRSLAASGSTASLIDFTTSSDLHACPTAVPCVRFGCSNEADFLSRRGFKRDIRTRRSTQCFLQRGNIKCFACQMSASFYFFFFFAICYARKSGKRYFRHSRVSTNRLRLINTSEVHRAVISIINPSTGTNVLSFTRDPVFSRNVVLSSFGLFRHAPSGDNHEEEKEEEDSNDDESVVVPLLAHGYSHGYVCEE